jgi:hypothetical protein
MSSDHTQEVDVPDEMPTGEMIDCEPSPEHSDMPQGLME